MFTANLRAGQWTEGQLCTESCEETRRAVIILNSQHQPYYFFTLILFQRGEFISSCVTYR